jgi:hypothetical protein
MSEERFDEGRDELTREERTAFQELDGAAPPPELEERVLSALREQDLVRRDPWYRRWLAPGPAPRLALGGAALAVTFLLGMEYGRRAAEPKSPEAQLETEAVEEPTPPAGGAMMAALDREGSVPGGYPEGKPRLGELADNGRGQFPVLPLDGTERVYSPKYR